MLDFIKTFRDRSRASREIGALGHEVLDDLGVTRSGLQRLAFTPRAVLQRLTAMARRHQVDQHAVLNDLYALPILVERCGNCRDTRACAAFLADASATAGQATFCPNLPAFTRMAASAKPH